MPYSVHHTILDAQRTAPPTLLLLLRADVQQRVETALRGALDGHLLMHEVRLVAPNKKMLCLSFRIPASIAFEASRSARRSSIPDGCQSSGSGDLNVVQQNKKQRT